jgi:hypothetical protein
LRIYSITLTAAGCDPPTAGEGFAKTVKRLLYEGVSTSKRKLEEERFVNSENTRRLEGYDEMVPAN